MRKDLKRKKAMNIILFLFITIASMPIAASVNLLYTTTTALEHFKLVSNTADNLILAYSNEQIDRQMEDWAKDNSKIKDIQGEDMLLVIADDITVPGKYKKVENGPTLLLTKIPEKNNLIFNQEDKLFTLDKGEIALPMFIKNSTGIQTGDAIKIKIGEITKDFTVKYLTKDVVFDSAIMGFRRLVLCEEDFNDFYSAENKTVRKLWSVTKAGNVTYEDVEKDFSKTSIPPIVTFIICMKMRRRKRKQPGILKKRLTR